MSMTKEEMQHGLYCCFLEKKGKLESEYMKEVARIEKQYKVKQTDNLDKKSPAYESLEDARERRNLEYYKLSDARRLLNLT